MRGLLYGFTVCLFGCGGAIPKPADFVETSEPLLAAIAKRAQAIRSLSGEIKLEIWRKGQRVRLKQMLAVDPESRLRLEVISPFGQPVTTLVSDGARLMIYAVDEKRFLVGAATAENMARLMPVNMSPNELSNLLRGSIPLIRHTQSSVGWDGQNGRYILTLTGEERRQIIRLEPTHFRVTDLESTVKGNLVYRVRFGAYSGDGKTIIPKRVLFEVPSQDLRADMDVVDFSLNPDLPEAAFKLEPPRGISVEPM